MVGDCEEVSSAWRTFSFFSQGLLKNYDQYKCLKHKPTASGSSAEGGRGMLLVKSLVIEPSGTLCVRTPTRLVCIVYDVRRTVAKISDSDKWNERYNLIRSTNQTGQDLKERRARQTRAQVQKLTAESNSPKLEQLRGDDAPPETDWGIPAFDAGPPSTSFILSGG